MQYVALDVLKKTQRVWAVADRREADAEAILGCLVRCARDKPWWDTIDILSTYVLEMLWGLRFDPVGVECSVPAAFSDSWQLLL